MQPGGSAKISDVLQELWGELVRRVSDQADAVAQKSCENSADLKILIEGFSLCEKAAGNAKKACENILNPDRPNEGWEILGVFPVTELDGRNKYVCVCFKTSSGSLSAWCLESTFQGDDSFKKSHFEMGKGKGFGYKKRKKQTDCETDFQRFEYELHKKIEAALKDTSFKLNSNGSGKLRRIQKGPALQTALAEFRKLNIAVEDDVSPPAPPTLAIQTSIAGNKQTQQTALTLAAGEEAEFKVGNDFQVQKLEMLIPTQKAATENLKVKFRREGVSSDGSGSVWQVKNNAPMASASDQSAKDKASKGSLNCASAPPTFAVQSSAQTHQTSQEPKDVAATSHTVEVGGEHFGNWWDVTSSDDDPFEALIQSMSSTPGPNHVDSSQTAKEHHDQPEAARAPQSSGIDDGQQHDNRPASSDSVIRNPTELELPRQIVEPSTTAVPLERAAQWRLEPEDVDHEALTRMHHEQTPEQLYYVANEPELGGVGFPEVSHDEVVDVYSERDALDDVWSSSPSAAEGATLEAGKENDEPEQVEMDRRSSDKDSRLAAPKSVILEPPAQGLPFHTVLHPHTNGRVPLEVEIHDVSALSTIPLPNVGSIVRKRRPEPDEYSLGTSEAKSASGVFVPGAENDWTQHAEADIYNITRLDGLIPQNGMDPISKYLEEDDAVRRKVGDRKNFVFAAASGKVFVPTEAERPFMEPYRLLAKTKKN